MNTGTCPSKNEYNRTTTTVVLIFKCEKHVSREKTKLSPIFRHTIRPTLNVFVRSRSLHVDPRLLLPAPVLGAACPTPPAAPAPPPPATSKSPNTPSSCLSSRSSTGSSNLAFTASRHSAHVGCITGVPEATATGVANFRLRGAAFIPIGELTLLLLPLTTLELPAESCRPDPLAGQLARLPPPSPSPNPWR